METFPIAPVPQTEPVQSSSPSAAPESASGFDQTLNKAISSTESVPKDHNGSQQNDNGQSSTSDPTRSSEKSTQNESSQITQSTSANTDTSATTQSNSTSQTGESSSATIVTSLSVHSSSSSIKVSGALMNASLALPSGSVPSDIDFAAHDPLATNQNGASRYHAIFQSQQLSIQIENSTRSLNLTNTSSQPVAAKENLMLAQIQSLISAQNDQVQMNVNFGNNSPGTLPGYMSAPVIVEGGGNGVELSIKLSGTQASGTSGLTSEVATQQKSDTILQTLRQDAQGQYINAKVSGIENQKDTQAETNSNNQNSSNQQNASTTASQTGQTVQGQAGTAVNADQATLNQGFSAQFTDLSAAKVADIAKPIQLPNGQLLSNLQEQEVINQIVNRFSLTNRFHTSRISLQLHPAQLGELKIDVLVKGDSLKANIFAQTQQAQDLIEKNLPRLRAVLNENGLRVEDLFVTLESDTVDDFSKQQSNQFDDALNDFQNQVGKGVSKSDSFTALTEAEKENSVTADQTTGLNVTA
ncbi:MAG: flagellar hook-length control protein FliK [Desulfobulbaceae bacterium]|nr:MAG: flagellar hook-length control protein FliK [Desulfobulbaceae bacterium]